MKKVFFILAVGLLIAKSFSTKMSAQTTIGPAKDIHIPGHYQNDGLLGGIYVHCDGTGDIDCVVPNPNYPQNIK